MTLKAHGRFLRSGEDRSSVAETHPRTRWDWTSFFLTWVQTSAGRLPWRRLGESAVSA